MRLFWFLSESQRFSFLGIDSTVLCCSFMKQVRCWCIFIISMMQKSVACFFCIILRVEIGHIYLYIFCAHYLFPFLFTILFRNKMMMDEMVVLLFSERLILDQKDFCDRKKARVSFFLNLSVFCVVVIVRRYQINKKYEST